MEKQKPLDDGLPGRDLVELTAYLIGDCVARYFRALLLRSQLAIFETGGASLICELELRRSTTRALLR